MCHAMTAATTVTFFFWVQTFDVTIMRGQDSAFVSKGLKAHNAHGKVEKL
jgi:hypothetical protein